MTTAKDANSRPLFYEPGASWLWVLSGAAAAARIHVSVELTPEALRQGTQTLLVREIVKVFPEPEHPANSDNELAKWQSSRALGELFGVPRGRTGIVLKLTEGRTTQAWAKRHRQLRDALTLLVQERVEPARSDATDLDHHDDDGSPL
ncbi:DUF3093 domain-containing protein [Mycobacterium tilburgii]|uniref:DUF3093 domain-containing protein n=1 Tax=Mycobacterium tilburgii TaxID=44467 RepID=UPI0021B4A5C3|nr:DUF3093 domain-containing protein [Mycobacterium tilburgii]